MVYQIINPNRKQSYYNWTQFKGTLQLLQDNPTARIVQIFHCLTLKKKKMLYLTKVSFYVTFWIIISFCNHCLQFKYLLFFCFHQLYK